MVHDQMVNRFTLSELCAKIGEALDSSLAPAYWVQAEISSLIERGGHMYLDLVDAPSAGGQGAKMRATLWAGTKEMLCAYFQSETGMSLQKGMAVLVECEVHFHPVYGLSLSIVGIDPTFTIGDIARLKQQTIAQLEKDGLLEAQQLLPLPTLIRKIAVISSPSAAGYEDFKHQLEHSPYGFETTLFGATMQGDGAPKSIIAALEEISVSASGLSAKRSIRQSRSLIASSSSAAEVPARICRVSITTSSAPFVRNSSCRY